MSDLVEIIDIGKGDPAIAFVHGACCLPTDYQWRQGAFSETNRVIAPVFRADRGEGVASNDLRIARIAPNRLAATCRHMIIWAAEWFDERLSTVADIPILVGNRGHCINLDEPEQLKQDIEIWDAKLS